MTDPKHFVVLKIGIYIQDVRGPYTSLGDATQAADGFAASDVDDHHVWTVWKLTEEGIGKYHEFGTMFSELFEYNETQCLYSTGKEKAP